MVVKLFCISATVVLNHFAVQGAKSRPTILLDSRTKIFCHKSIDTFCFFALTKSVSQNIRCVTERMQSRTKDAWELHAALRIVSTIGIMVFIDDKNLINKIRTKTICCQIMALKFVNIYVC